MYSYQEILLPVWQRKLKNFGGLYEKKRICANRSNFDPNNVPNCLRQ